jgi:hypothetical protein
MATGERRLARRAQRDASVRQRLRRLRPTRSAQMAKVMEVPVRSTDLQASLRTCSCEDTVSYINDERLPRRANVSIEGIKLEGQPRRPPADPWPDRRSIRANRQGCHP